MRKLLLYSILVWCACLHKQPFPLVSICIVAQVMSLYTVWHSFPPSWRPSLRLQPPSTHPHLLQTRLTLCVDSPAIWLLRTAPVGHAALAQRSHGDVPVTSESHNIIIVRRFSLKGLCRPPLPLPVTLDPYSALWFSCLCSLWSAEVWTVILNYTVW